MPAHKLPVSIYMTSPTYTVVEDDSLEHAYQIMLGRKVSSLAVVDPEGGLAGVVTRSDLLHVGVSTERSRWSNSLTLPDKQVREVMTKGAVSVAIGASMGQAAGLMAEHHVQRVFVISVNGIVGVVSTKDVMRALADLEMAEPLSGFMSSPVRAIRSSESLSDATLLLERSGLHGLVVVDKDRPVGMFAHIDALEARHWPGDCPVDKVMNARILCLEKDTPVHRAALQAEALRVRRVLCMDRGQLIGILTGIDFARALKQAR